MSTDLLVIVDDDSGAFSYSWSGGTNTSASPWVLSTLTQWYRATSWYTASSTQTGTFTFTFDGTSAAFIGNTPTSPSPQTATVQIDNGTSFSINYEDPNPPTYQQWFITPTLPDGEHTITVSNLHGTAIDYAVVKVGNQTSLSNQTVIVDDDSSLIQYSGQWSRNTNEFIPASLPTGYPYANGTHRSSNPGDTFTFQFSGTSLAVYGIFSWFNLGSLTASYALDGTPYSSSISVTTSSPSYLNKDGEVSNYLYFGLDNLSSGTHTLVVNVTEATNQDFILDYITYKPSFDTLSSMPSLSLTGSSTSHKSSATLAGSSTAASSGSKQPVPTGAIVGGLIGALAFGVLLTVLVMLLLKRRRRAREEKYAYQDVPLTGGGGNHSYTGNPSDMHQPSNGAIAPFALHDSQRRYGADGKHNANERSISTTDPNSSTSGVPRSSITGTSTGIEEQPFVDPPSYDTISQRIGRQA